MTHPLSPVRVELVDLDPQEQVTHMRPVRRTFTAQVNAERS
ncbi:hypothetical protein [Streptomyces sp. NPDC057910]